MIRINGRQPEGKTEAGKYARIHRTWSNGDVVTLELPMMLSIKQWEMNKNSISVNYGPLTFSLKIQERYEKLDIKTTAIGDSKWQEGADATKWPTYEIYPQSPWNYALQINKKNILQSLKVVKKHWSGNDFPFTTESVPIEMDAKGQRVPSWKIDKFGLCGVLPDEHAVKDQKVEDIILIPMGAARLRISAFPIVEPHDVKTSP